MTVLRIYDPAECDLAGVPLDWERCRACGGTGKDGAPQVEALPTCYACDGHGSLKAAALDHARRWLYPPPAGDVEMIELDGDLVVPDSRPGERCPVCGRVDEVAHVHREPRCEDCGHPMSEGTWADDPDGHRGLDAEPVEQLMTKDERARFWQGQDHYSRCDEGCRHSDPVVLRRDDSWQGRSPWFASTAPDWLGEVGKTAGEVAANLPVWASWRPVDVRTLGWPHDLRPERLAVLCLRCYAERTR